MVLQALLFAIAIIGLVTRRFKLRDGYEVAGRPALLLSVFYGILGSAPFFFSVPDSALFSLFLGSVCFGVLNCTRQVATVGDMYATKSSALVAPEKEPEASSGGNLSHVSGRSMLWKQFHKRFKVIEFVFALLAGYALFPLLQALPLSHYLSIEGLPLAQVFIANALVKEGLLGIISSFLFLSSRSLLTVFLVYVGYGLAYIQLVTLPGGGFDVDGVMRGSLIPPLLSLLTGVVIVTGVKFLKAWGVLFILINIFLVAQYDYYQHSGRFIFLDQLQRPAESPSSLGTIDSRRCYAEDDVTALDTQAIVWRCQIDDKRFYSYVSVDGRDQKSYYNISPLSLSYNGKEWSYRAYLKQGDLVKSLFVVGEKEYELPEILIDQGLMFVKDVDVSHVILSKDGEHLAYAVNQKNGDIDIFLDQKLFRSHSLPIRYEDQEKCEPTFHVSEFSFTPNNTLVYVLRNTKKFSGDSCQDLLFLDGELYDSHTEWIEFAVVNERGDVAYLKSGPGTPEPGMEFDRGELFLLLNREVQATSSFPFGLIHDPLFSKSGDTLCYFVTSHGAADGAFYALSGGKSRLIEESVMKRDFSSKVCADNMSGGR